MINQSLKKVKERQEIYNDLIEEGEPWEIEVLEDDHAIAQTELFQNLYYQSLIVFILSFCERSLLHICKTYEASNEIKLKFICGEG